MSLIFFHHLILSCCFSFITWCLYLKVRNSSIIDINWVLGFGFLVIYDYFIYPVYFLDELTDFSFSVFHVFVVGLVWIWALRLAIFFLVTRILKNIQDTRYSYLKKSYKSNVEFKVLGNYMFQGVLQSVLSLIFVAGFYSNVAFDFIIILFLIGCFFAVIAQAIADFQLHKFKLSSGPTDVCDVGFWFYSRHPNYFFEVVFWVCLAGVFYFSSGLAWCFFAPLFIYLIMRYLTGPLTEKLSIAKRGQVYLEYMQNTPMIFLNIFKRK